jgi:hypothetical protein
METWLPGRVLSEFIQGHDNKAGDSAVLYQRGGFEGIARGAESRAPPSERTNVSHSSPGGEEAFVSNLLRVGLCLVKLFSYSRPPSSAFRPPGNLFLQLKRCLGGLVFDDLDLFGLGEGL